MKLTPVDYDPFKDEEQNPPESGLKLTPVDFDPFPEDAQAAPVQAAPAVPPVQPVSGKAERAALVRPVGIEARLDQAQRQAQADKDPVLAPEEDPSLWENFKTGLREVGSDARDMLGYAPEQALAISTQAIDFLPAMVRGVRETNRQVWGAILGEDKVQQLEEMQKKVPVLGTILKAGEKLLDVSGNLRRDAQELLIQKAMDEGGVSGVVAASLVDTVMQTLMQLKTFKALRIQYGKQPDIKSTLMGAGMRAALSAISHEGLSPKERIGAFALSMAYQSTPALSGTIGKWTKSDWVAKGVDIAANAGITTTQWAQMVEDSHAEAEARGMPESSGIFLIMNLVKSYGSDVVFGAMTDAFRQRGNPEAARVLEKAAQDAGVPVKRKPVLAKPPVAEEPAREAEQPAPVETPVKTPVESAPKSFEQRLIDIGFTPKEAEATISRIKAEGEDVDGAVKDLEYKSQKMVKDRDADRLQTADLARRARESEEVKQAEILKRRVAQKPPAIEPEPILPPSTPPVETPKGDRLRPTGEAADRTEALVSEQARQPAPATREGEAAAKATPVEELKAKMKPAEKAKLKSDIPTQKEIDDHTEAMLAKYGKRWFSAANAYGGMQKTRQQDPNVAKLFEAELPKDIARSDLERDFQMNEKASKAFSDAYATERRRLHDVVHNELNELPRSVTDAILTAAGIRKGGSVDAALAFERVKSDSFDSPESRRTAFIDVARRLHPTLDVDSYLTSNVSPLTRAGQEAEIGRIADIVNRGFDALRNGIVPAESRKQLTPTIKPAAPTVTPVEQARPPAAAPEKAAELMTPEETYKPVSEKVDGRIVRTGIPNMSSIDASVPNSETLSGIREVPMSDFELTGKHYSVEGDKRIAELADQIGKSGEISPLIVVLEKDGPYILEGATRADALKRIGAKSFPAKVVINLDDPPSGYVREGDRYVFKGEAAPKPVDALKAKMAKGKKEAVKTTAIDALKAKMADKIQTQQTDKGDVRVSVPEKDTPKITPKEQKKYIIEELDVAIKDAPMALESMPPKGKNDSDWSVKQNKAIEKAAKAENITPEQWIANNHRASEGDPDKVIIEVPGDGVFTVKNDKSVLMAFREQVRSKLPTETKEKRTERLKAFETDAEREGWGKQVSQFEERRAESMRKVKRKVKKKDIIPARYIDPYGIPIPKGYIKLRPYSAFYEYNPASINPKPAPIPGMKAAAAEKAVPEKIEETSQSGFAFVPAGMPGVRDALNWTFRQHGGVDERIVPKIEKWQRQRNMIDLSAKMMSDNVRMVKDELNALGLKDDVKQSYSSDTTKVMEGVMRLDEFKKKHGYIFGSTNPKLRAAAEKTVGFLDKIRDYREKFVSDIVPTMKRIGLSDEAATIEANKMMYVPYEYMKWIDPFFKPKAADKERAVDTIKSEYVNDIIKLRGNVNAFGEYDKILSFLKTGDMTGLKQKDAQQEVALNTLRQDFLSMTPFIKDIQLQKETGQIDFDMRLGNIQSSAREYVDSLLTGRKSGGTGNPFDVSHLMKRKLPEVFQQLYGRIEDPERVVNSMVKIQQNLLNTTRFLDQILSMNSDDSGRPIYSAKPSPENGLTVKLTGKQYAALDGMYVSKELARVLRDDIIRFKQSPTTIPDKVADAVKDFYRLSVKTGRTAAIFTSRLVQRNIQTNLTYPMMSGDWLRKGHVKHEADGWKLVADVYQYMAGRVPAGSERYKRVTKMLQELGDNGVYYIKQSGIGADLDAFADNHGFMTPSKAPAVIKQWYESKLDEARSYYSLADLPYKYAMWKTALERFKGDKEKAREHVQRYGQYPEKLGRGLKSWSKLPLADFPTFMFDAVRIHANATVDFAKNVANLGRGGDWQQVIGYLIGTATSAAVMTPSAKAIKLGFKKGMDAIRNVVQGEDQDTEFQELEPEQEGALYDLVPRYDQNNPSYIWKEVRKDGQVTIRRIPTRGFTTPLPLMEMSSGVLNRNILQAGGLSKLLKDKKRMAKIPLEIMQEFASNLLQTGMIPQAYLRTLIGQEAGIVKTSTYKTPEGGLIGVWKSEDPRKFSKVASILAQNAGEMFPPLFLSQQSQRNLKRIVQQSEKSPEGLGDPMTQKTITDVAANTVLPLRVYTINASSARTATLQNISPFITEIQSAKRQKEVDNYLIEHHYSHLIEIVQKCKKSFVDTGVMKEAALMQILIDSGLSRQEALMIFNKQMPAAYRRKSKITTKEKFESIQKR